ncbi:MAG: NADH-quinone oxidoreductase subunit C [bacterium]
MVEERLREIEGRIKGTFPDILLGSEIFRGELTVIVKNQNVEDFFRFLRDDDGLAFNFLVDITAVDYLEWPEGFPTRFAVVYHLLSWKTEDRLRVKVAVEEDNPVVPTIVPLWSAANWLEREVYDMFGIRFEGHPDLRRILMWDSFKDHPLRKDYPLKGKGERDNFPRVERAFKPRYFLEKESAGRLGEEGR